MATTYRFRALLLMLVLLAVFIGTFGTLLTIPLALLIAFTLSAVFTNFLGSQWLPTPGPVIAAVVKEAKARKCRTFYDLGSGDGRVVIAVARKTGAGSVGIEIDPVKFLISSVRIRLSGANAMVLRQSFFKADLSGADAIFCYLPTATMEKLEPEIRKMKGKTIICYCIRFPNLKPVKEIKSRKLFVYKT